MLVTCIVPFYNVEEYIAECYTSLKKQTYPHLELIFVDNNSTDKSVEVLKKMMEGDKDVVLITEKKQGASAARNTGLRMAKGNYIQFLDADDMIGPDKISRQVKLLQSVKPSAALVVGNFTRHKGAQQDIYTAFKSDIWLGLMKTRLGCTCSNLWRHDKLIEAGGWNEELKSSQEYDLMFRLLKKKAMVIFDHEADTIVRTRSSGNISSTDPGDNMHRYCHLRYEILNYLKQQIKPVDMKPYYQVFFDAIRMLAKFDLQKAVEYHKAEIPRDFVPVVTETSSGMYVFLYKIFGFSLTEKLRKQKV